MFILINAAKMDNFLIIFISVFFAAVSNGANPHVHFKSQNIPLGIVNGTDAEDGEFPYVVQLYTGNHYICGGAIIDEKWILTSGQCIGSGVNAIVYGMNVLAEISPSNNKIKVKRRILHPKFDYYRKNYVDIPLYDVAVLELEEPIKFSDKAQPLKLAENNDVPFHVPGVLAGWGYGKTDGKFARTLQKVELELLDDSECSVEINRRANFDAFNGVHAICSDSHYRGQCNGDAGSPFVINGLIYGVVSWSFKPCGTSPGAYSRITNPEYRRFIRNITGI